MRLDLYKIWLNKNKMRLNMYKIWLNIKKMRLNLYKIWLNKNKMRLNMYKIWLNIKKMRLNLYKIWLNKNKMRLNMYKIWLNINIVSILNGLKYAKLILNCDTRTRPLIAEELYSQIVPPPQNFVIINGSKGYGETLNRKTWMGSMTFHIVALSLLKAFYWLMN